MRKFEIIIIGRRCGVVRWSVQANFGFGSIDAIQSILRPFCAGALYILAQFSPGRVRKSQVTMLRNRQAISDFQNKNSQSIVSENLLQKSLQMTLYLVFALILMLIITMGLFGSQSNAASRSFVIHHNYSKIKHKSGKIRHHRVIPSRKLTSTKRHISSGNRLKGHSGAKRNFRSNGSYGHFGNYGTGHYGPLIINIPRTFRTRGSSSINHYKNVSGSDNYLERHELPNGGVFVNSRPRAAYYNDKKCNDGGTCIIRLGPNRSAPKLIVIGETE